MGWQDFQTQITGGITLFHHLKVPKRLYLLPGGHGVVLGQKVFQDDQVRWFDRWLKGTENGVEREQPVTVFWEVARKGGTALGGGVSTANWITTYSAWPPPETQTQPFYLTGDAAAHDEQANIRRTDGTADLHLSHGDRAHRKQCAILIAGRSPKVFSSTGAPR